MKGRAASSSTLLESLGHLVPGASMRTLRQMLAHGRVRLQGAVCKVGSRPVNTGDLIEIGAGEDPRQALQGIKIQFEDDDLLVIVKPAGLLTVATEHEKERTAYAVLRARLGTRNRGARLHVVHRLDKFVSGVLVFAKTLHARERLKALFRSHEIDRRYWAIVEGSVEADAGTLRDRLAEGPSGRVRVVSGHVGKQAVTHFRVLKRSAQQTALEIRLETGRKNQIRAHLAHWGHPIAGDRSYGSHSDPLRRIGLHAFLLAFEHPSQRKVMRFWIDPPPEFRRFLPRIPDGSGQEREKLQAERGRREAGSGRREAGRGKREAGSRRRTAGSGWRKREAGGRVPEGGKGKAEGRRRTAGRRRRKGGDGRR